MFLCGRKNPLHRKEFKHSRRAGTSSAQTPGAELPVCTVILILRTKSSLSPCRSCLSAARSTRTAPSTQAGDDEDEDEYEDSFINDSSDEAFDDSDYVPAGSDDSGTEELKNNSQDSLRSK